MNTPLVSIVVPIYNSEKYLNECLESLINQDYENVEIILINDGSNDYSDKICTTYLQSHPKIIYFKKNNGGAASARNYGIEKANGKYLLFIDSDDYLLSKEAISLLVKKSELNNLDILFFSGIASDESKHTTVKCHWYQHTKNLNNIELGIDNMEKSVRYREYNTHVGMRFINLEYLKNINLKFNENMRALEDEEFSFILHSKANRVMNISNIFYHRRYRPNSIMTSLDGYSKGMHLIKLINSLNKYSDNKIERFNKQLLKKINGHIYQLQKIYNCQNIEIRHLLEDEIMINKDILNKYSENYNVLSKRTINNISKNIIISKIFFKINAIYEFIFK